MRTFDLYILRQTLAPLTIALVVGLVVLLIERMLRLLDFVLGSEGPLRVVLEIMAFLVPQYVALALPVSLMLGVMFAFHRLSRDGEIEAFYNAGVSLARLSRMTAVVAVVVMAVLALTLGFLKPYSRYAYQSVLHTIADAAFEALIRPGIFTDFGNMTFYIDRILPDRAVFQEVFLHRANEDGGSTVITAREGSLAASSTDGAPILKLYDGVRLTLQGNLERAREAQRNSLTQPPDVGVLRFQELRTGLGARDVKLFRPRGVDEREYTIVELWRHRHQPPPGVRVSDMLAELNSRIVRVLSVPFLPLLAVPLALGRRRSDRSWGIVTAMLILIVYNQVLDLGKNIAETGDIDPLLGLWLPFAVFATASVWLHYRASSRLSRSLGFRFPDPRMWFRRPRTVLSQGEGQP